MTVELKKALARLSSLRRRCRLVLVLAALALLLAACAARAESFAIVSGSENTVLEPIVEEFCKKQGATCTFTYRVRSISASRCKGRRHRSGRRVAGFQRLDRPVRHGRKVKNLTSIAQMPVILGVRKSKAEELGWIGKDVLMGDILAAVEQRQLNFLMTSATQSNSGASAYLAMLSSALGGKPRDRARRSRRSDGARHRRSCCAASSAPPARRGWLAELYRRVGAERRRATMRCGTTRRCSRRPTTSCGAGQRAALRHLSGRWRRRRPTRRSASRPWPRAEVEKFFTDLSGISAFPMAQARSPQPAGAFRSAGRSAQARARLELRPEHGW